MPIANEPHESGICPAQLRLDVPLVLRWLGYGAAGVAAPAHIHDEAETVLALAKVLMLPRWVWRAMPMNPDPAGGVLHCGEDGARSLAAGRVVLAQLVPAEAVAVFVITIGSRLEIEARRRIAEGDAVAGFMLDAIGSAAVEACADALAAEILAVAQQHGWQTTNRFSPGYCTWPTGDQCELFKLLPPRPVGVTLSDHALMQPIKSISGLIGLGPRVKNRPYICDRCGVEDCRQRLKTARPVCGAVACNGHDSTENNHAPAR
jgi:hypothetical protein